MKSWKLGGCALLLAGTAFTMGNTAPAANTSTASGKAPACAAFAATVLGPDVRITSATHVDASGKDFVDPNGWTVAGLPAHCRVEGVVNERKGAGGKTYGIRFAMALPDDWSGRFLLQGGGGLNGSVLPPTGPVASDGRPALARGFAVISSDSGHQGVVFDDSFMADQRAALDFAESSVRTVALLGKQVTQSYYGKPADHSYMTGCSTGGREGMLASQRYPELFDGIIVGAPAMRTGDSNLGVEYTQVLFNQAAPLGTDGKPDFTQILTAADRTTLLNGILDQCDALDGLKDGMIENVAKCDFKPAKLQCTGAKKDGCLSAGQVRALELGLAGPSDKAGFPIYTRMAADTGIMSTPMGYLPTGGPGPFGPPSTATSIDLDARIHAIRQDAAQRLTDTNYWTNLNTYLDRGGKIMFFHGVSDFWFSPFATWDWYQRAQATNGQAFTDASRFYMVPGMLHCQGGNAYDQFDMLGKLVDWVEQGKAPQEVIAHRKNPAVASRPLCPYPAYAHYTGGDPDKASSFACKMPD
ncbi:tannase/feruloyl esterase family alpha/beta hydrolase [Altererythrobacter fulvus]|uniref:tannase/feruloyl esterase family alpha/beta hydrolase n=1 Tax=Caenibius fulvus TaxID=2126012 RepID=UPI0030168710